MKTFLIELCQKSPRWSRPIKHIKANSADDAKNQFQYLLDGAASGMFLRAHELKYNEFAEVVGHEDCADCFSYLHTSEKYVCNSCNAEPTLLSAYDLAEGEGQVNCEFCDKPLTKQRS